MISVTLALDLDRLIILQISQELPKIFPTVVGQNKYNLLDILQVINKAAEHLAIGIDQRLYILQVIRICVIVEKREEWHLAGSMLICLRILAEFRIHHKHLIRQQLIQLITRFQSVRAALFVVPVFVYGIRVTGGIINILIRA